MPKLKTRKSVAKRFRFTKSGKIRRRRAGKSHILTKKSRKRKRNLRKDAFASGVDKWSLEKQLPYGK